MNVPPARKKRLKNGMVQGVERLQAAARFRQPLVFYNMLIKIKLIIKVIIQIVYYKISKII